MHKGQGFLKTLVAPLGDLVGPRGRHGADRGGVLGLGAVRDAEEPPRPCHSFASDSSPMTRATCAQLVIAQLEHARISLGV